MMKNLNLGPMIALRLYIAVSSFITYLIIALEEQSFVHKVLMIRTDGAPVIVGIGASVAFIAICDTIVNDILPERYKLIHTKRYRHLGFMILAMMAAFGAYFIASSFGPTLIIARYLFDAGTAASVSFLGLKDLLPFPFHERRQYKA